jgi:long-subunit acyl-CoA synthetase (AMP-forming)
MDTWADIEAKGSRPNVKSQAALKTWGAEKGVAVMDFTELLSLGAQFPHAHIAPAPSDIASLCYTSGTTGKSCDGEESGKY